jgi:acetyl esterase/lipase
MEVSLYSVQGFIIVTIFTLMSNHYAVVGHSAGGYLALMAGFVLNPTPRAVVSFYGYGDIAGAWYSRPDSFYSRQPLDSKEEVYKAIGTQIVSDDREPHGQILSLYPSTGSLAHGSGWP